MFLLWLMWLDTLAALQRTQEMTIMQTQTDGALLRELLTPEARAAQTGTLGLTVAFTSQASATLAGVPAVITAVYPLAIDTLVTLEYAHPVRVHRQMLRHVNALLSELEVLA